VRDVVRDGDRVEGGEGADLGAFLLGDLVELCGPNESTHVHCAGHTHRDEISD